MAGSVLGSVASGVVGGLFNDKAEKQIQRGADASQQIFTPQPFRPRSSFFNIGADGRGNYTQSGRNNFQNLARLHSKTFHRLDNFNRGAFADRLLEASNRVNDDRENQAFSSLESKLFNTAGASTGTQRQIADFQSDIEDRRFNRALQAQIGAQQFERGLYDDFNTRFNNMLGFDDRLVNAQRQSLAAGRLMLPTTANNPGAFNAGAFQAQNTQDFGAGLGDLIGGGVQAGFDYFNNRSAPVSSPSFSLGNPFTYRPSNPFNGSGPQLSFGNGYLP